MTELRKAAEKALKELKAVHKQDHPDYCPSTIRAIQELEKALREAKE